MENALLKKAEASGYKNSCRAYFLLLLPLVLLFFVSPQISKACSLVDVPLRQYFRKAESVFVGKVIKVKEIPLTESEKSLVPQGWKDWGLFGKVTLDATKKWKGDVPEKHEYIAVTYFDCGCQTYQGLKEGQELLVFLSEKNFVFVCNTEKTDSEETRKRMRRLDSVLFRTWARMYPF